MIPGSELENRRLSKERKRSMTYYNQFMKLIQYRRKSMITHSEMADALTYMNMVDSTVYPATVEELAQLENDVNHGLSPVANSYIRVMGLVLSMFGDPRLVPKLSPNNSAFVVKMHDIRNSPGVHIAAVSVTYMDEKGQRGQAKMTLTAKDSTRALLDVLIAIGEKAQRLSRK